MSNIDGKSYKAMVKGISEEITDPEELVKLIHGRIVSHHGKDIILASLKGVVSPAETDMIAQLREETDLAEKHREKCREKRLEICGEKFPEELKRLQTITEDKGTFGHIINRRDRNGHGQARNGRPPFIMKRSEAEKRRIQQEDQITEHHPRKCISPQDHHGVRMGSRQEYFLHN